MGGRPKQTFLQRRHTDGQQAHEKITQHHLSLGKCKPKRKWGIISCQSEWPSSNNLQTTNAGEDVETREPSCTAGENVH